MSFKNLFLIINGGIYFEDFDGAFFNKFSTGNKEFPLLNFWSTSNFMNIFIKN